jgi:NADH-quinone oxidoreductase subunit L
VRPDLPRVLREKARFIVNILENKYGFDRFYDWFFAGGARALGTGLWQRGDVRVIDGFFVNGSARLVGWASTVIRRLQSGYIYHYAFSMIIGVLLLLSVLLLPLVWAR